MRQQMQNPAGGPGLALKRALGTCRSLLCLTGYRVKVLAKHLLMVVYCRGLLPRRFVQACFNLLRLAHV